MEVLLVLCLIMLSTLPLENKGSNSGQNIVFYYVLISSFRVICGGHTLG